MHPTHLQQNTACWQKFQPQNSTEENLSQLNSLLISQVSVLVKIIITQFRVRLQTKAATTQQGTGTSSI